MNSQEQQQPQSEGKGNDNTNATKKAKTQSTKDSLQDKTAKAIAAAVFPDWLYGPQVNKSFKTKDDYKNASKQKGKAKKKTESERAKELAAAMYELYKKGSDDVVPIQDEVSCLNESHTIAMEKVMDVLGLYYDNITTSYGLPKYQLTAHRSAQKEKGVKQYAKGHSGAEACTQSIFVYCRNCRCSDAKVDGLRLCILAEICFDVFDTEVKVEDDMPVQYARIGCKAIKLYPHDSQCMVDPKYRRNVEFDKEHGGTGFDINRAVPAAELFRDLVCTVLSN